MLSGFSSKARISGGMGVHNMGSLHVLEGTMNAERYIKVLEQHMLPSRRRVFQGRPCVFQQDNAKPHTAAITTANAELALKLAHVLQNIVQILCLIIYVIYVLL